MGREDRLESSSQDQQMKTLDLKFNSKTLCTSKLKTKKGKWITNSEGGNKNQKVHLLNSKLKGGSKL